MKIWKLTPMTSWAARGLGAAALMSGLLTALPAQADDSAVITAYAPGAPESAWIAVQWQNTDSTWHTVDGWQGDLDYTSSGVPFKQWAVASANYGTGPFRFVVYAQENGTVWATSESFTLPSSLGENVEETLKGSAAAVPTTAAASTVLDSWTENLVYDNGGAATARITMEIAGVSPTAYAGVQYLDASGVWQNVEGWQSAVTINEYGVAVVRWGVAAANLGEGSFRWVLYSAAGGAVIGVSPSFDLPTQTGIDYVMHLTQSAGAR